jgi:hypothetical protein
MTETFDRMWAEARTRLHARIDLMAAAAQAEAQGRSYSRSLAQLERWARGRACLPT